MMQRLVDTYQCEWAAVVRDPEKRKRFRQFVNTDETESCIEFVSERGQTPPGRLAERIRLAGAVPHARRPHARRARREQSDAQTALGRGRQASATSRTTAGRRSSTASRRSRSSTSPAAASGTPRRTCARTRRRSCCRAASSATPAGEPEGRLPAAQEDVLARNGRVAARRRVSIRTFPVKVEGDEVLLELPPAEVLDQAAGHGDWLPAGHVAVATSHPLPMHATMWSVRLE